MGLLKAFTQGVSSSFGDQFKEMVVCPEIEKNVLIQRGVVKHGSGNTNPTEGVISNGSKIVVPQGMAMMLIENGAIKEYNMGFNKENQITDSPSFRNIDQNHLLQQQPEQQEKQQLALADIPE